jgi:hypothetical protein
MKLFVLLAALSFAQLANADSNDFGSSDMVKKPIDVEKMRYQIEIKGEIFVFDRTGRRLLYKGDESRSWWFGENKPIISNWAYKQKNLPQIAIRHEWELDKDGNLSAKIKQYDAMERGQQEAPNVGKLLREQDFKIENFEAISWVAFQDDSKRVIVRLEPILWNNSEPSDVGKLPINSPRLTIYDKKGNLWAARIDNSGGKNIYFGATTHQGTVYLSYVPFPGAREIGSAEKRMIKIEDANTKLQIESSELLLPVGVSAKVYGKIDLSKRTDRFQSVRSFGSDQEKAFLTNLN